MKKKVSKSVTGLLAASLVITGVSWTDSSASAASPFSDVKPGWAEKHITKLALQGILKGGSGSAAGTFSPSKQVTRQEAVIIALRFMGVEEEVNKTEALVFPSVLVIKEDYKPYIKLALKKKILLIGEETELAEKEKGKEWGSSPATREWMTRLLVRAIGKEAEAELAKSQNTAFGDDAKIDAALKGYVNVAVSSGLITGITATKFDPLGTVTREMASTLFSRAEDKISVAYSGQVVGTLTAVAANKITLRHPDGVVKEYTLSPSASIYGYKSEATSTIDSLKLYSNVTLISNSDGTVGYLEQTGESANVKDYEGTLTLVTEAENKLTFLINNDYKPFNYDGKNPPTIKDINGQVLTINQLPLNVPVKFTVESAAGVDGKILSVTVNQSVTNKTGAGTVAVWDASGLSMQVKDSAGKTDTYPVASSATLKHNSANLTLDQLVVGDAISYEVKNGSVTSMVITKKVQPPITGVLSLVDKAGKTIQYTVNGELAAKYLADNVTVKIEGLSDVTLDDLFKGDMVSMTLNDSGKVSAISITNRSVTFLNGVVVSNYLPEDNILIITDAANKKIPLTLNETTRYDLNGKKITQKEANTYITKGKKINVGYTGSNIAYVSIVSQYAGTVLENNVTARTLKIALDTTNNVTLSYSTFAPTVEIYGQNYESYLDVHVGDKVTAVMDYLTQEQVIQVLVEKIVQFEYATADLTNNKLRAKRTDTGAIEEWSLTANTVALQDETGASISLSNLNQASPSFLNVTFKGNTPVKAKAVSTTYGRVTAVNAAGSSLDVVTSSGATVKKSFTTAPIVTKDNVTLGSLSSIQTDDRVEIRVDETDRTVIKIIPAVRKKIQFTDNNAKTVYVFIDSLGETNKYTVDPKAYIHQGTTTLSLADLKRDDSVSLYLIGGKVIEISK
ncbi:S-layer homology domain-containing protein [Cohnella cholangitidis]|uniref:S-layer homology domain-containing protein n=1 Tax=Cohnella cholangitidis TaxID=2598458 RepID=A0A7G5C5K2_9BACL|nr:S-layer homology domain-containing protein [Cohnella cholangitidis]QMV44486.1 S-layer homology domain-containing protein [Cohnella cholangitidis]